MRVLIVDDIEDMRELLRHVIDEIEGWEVSGVAASTWEARTEVDRNRPDLVLLDEVLPGESSFDFLKSITADGVPVFLITGIESPDHEIPSEALGRLGKPDWKNVDQYRQEIKTKVETALKTSS